MSLSGDQLEYVREIRDPLYGYIYVTRLESDVIDTKEFQRLDRLYQSPSTHYVYPNATHTRKAHSLGVMHLAHKAFLKILFHQCPTEFHTRVHPLVLEPSIAIQTRFLDKLDQRLNIRWWDDKTPQRRIQAFRLAGLLHDIGHGPFSHVFEDVCKGKGIDFKHEKMAAKILEERLADRLRGDVLADDVKFILGEGARSSSVQFLKDLIDGPYDIDKLDYLNRDSYHAGTLEYGKIDYERIIDGLRVRQGMLLIDKSAVGSLMSSFKAAEYMYANVYYHKACRVFDFMFYDALSLVTDFMEEIISDTSKFIEFDDYTFITEIKRKSTSDNNYSKAVKIFNDIFNRKMRYNTIAQRSLSLGVASDEKNNLDSLKTEFERNYEDLGTRIDHVGVRPIRVDPTRILEWLDSPRIFDEDDGTNPVKDLESLFPSYHEALRHYQVLVNVFVHREKSKSQDPDIRSRIVRLKKEIEQKIDEMQRRRRYR